KCLLSATTVIPQNSNTPPLQNKPATTTTATPPPTVPASKPPVTEGGQPAAPIIPPQDTTTPAPQKAKVVCVYRADKENDDKIKDIINNPVSCASAEREDWNSAGINDVIVIRVQGLKGL